MRKTLVKVGLSAAVMLLMSSSAYAQATANATLNVTATVASRARLTLSPTSINFADADPVATPLIPGGTVNIAVGARTTGSSTVSLTLQGTDLTSGGNSIAANNIAWTAGGAGFTSGTASTTAQTIGTWTGSGLQSGTHAFTLANSWAYVPGSYTGSLNYTLSVP